MYLTHNPEGVTSTETAPVQLQTDNRNRVAAVLVSLDFLNQLQTCTSLEWFPERLD